MVLPVLVSQKTRCKEFLRKFTGGTDPTWGFYVYGTYTRPQGQEDVDSGENSFSGKTAMVDDNAHFQGILNKFYSHVTDNLRYDYPAPYNQRMIDRLRLEPAAYMPNASFDDVCNHFRQYYARRLESEKLDEPGYQNKSDEEELFSPKYEWCLVIDDEALESLEKAPEPIGPIPPEGAKPYYLADNAYKAFAKLLSGRYTTMEKPVALSAKCRQGTEGMQWNGWFKFSPAMFKRVYEETDYGEIEMFFSGEDKLIDL